MTPRGFAILTCRLVAVLLVAFALQQLALFAPTFAASGVGIVTRAFSFAAAILAPLAGAVILWFSASRIAGFADDAGPAAATGLDEITFIRAGTALIGLAVASLAVADGIVFESMMLVHHRTPDLDDAYVAAIREQILEQRVDYLVRIVLGVFLMLGRGRLARLLGTPASAR